MPRNASPARCCALLTRVIVLAARGREYVPAVLLRAGRMPRAGRALLVTARAGSNNLPMQGAIRIGTSGWIYPHWRERFYPARLPQKKWFQYYCGHFDTVEINNTFYRLGRPE